MRGEIQSASDEQHERQRWETVRWRGERREKSGKAIRPRKFRKDTWTLLPDKATSLISLSPLSHDARAHTLHLTVHRFGSLDRRGKENPLVKLSHHETYKKSHPSFLLHLLFPFFHTYRERKVLSHPSLLPPLTHHCLCDRVLIDFRNDLYGHIIQVQYKSSTSALLSHPLT